MGNKNKRKFKILVEQLTGGFAQVSIAGGAQTTALDC